MSLNSQQRLIFVYLRDKDDNRSCTPAGAKLTNEYTCRTNKNDPCTVSVIPSQLCTFFRKRTPHIPPANSSWRKSSNSSLKIFYSPARNGKILRTYHFIPPKFHFIPPKNFFLPSWERHPFPANYFEILMCALSSLLNIHRASLN